MKQVSLFAIFTIVAMTMVFTGFAAAAEEKCPSGSVCISNPLKAGTFQELIDSITNIILIVALALAPIPILIAGYYFITSQGDPQKVQTARKMILYALVGLGIVFFAKAITSILKLVIGLK